MWLTAVVAACLLLMAFQLYRLTIPQSAMWQEQAREQRIREIPSYGTRGAIYDAKGRPLATSEPAYAAVLIGQDPVAIEKMMPQLALVLTDGDYQKAEEIKNRVVAKVWEYKKAYRQFEPLPILRPLSPTAVAAFMERRIEFPDVILVAESQRNYPQGAMGGALIGYVGAIASDELDSPEFTGYYAEELVGKAGLELSYEKLLRGKPGQNRVVINYVGKRVGGFDPTPPVPGNDLILSLDLDLQRLAEEALTKQIAWIKQQGDPEANPTMGAVVVQDVRTGAVLAMASVPTYNPNWMVKGMTDQQWQELQSQPGFSMYNWAVTGLSPGSTYKMATGYAGLESGLFSQWDPIDCPATYWRYDKPKNWTGYDQGPTNLGRAIATSCNPYFWEVAYNIGMDKIHGYYDLLGFGKKTGIDLPDESPGNNPSIASYGDRWAPGHILNVAIGQGDVLVTPLQLANYTGAIAMGGIRYQPYLVSEVRSATGQIVKKREPIAFPQIPAKPGTWEALQAGMRQAVTSPEGTANRPMMGFPIETAAKTGSAQTGGQYSDATTVVYAPYKNPQVAVSVVIKGGSKGSWATPVARRILAKYFGIDDKMPLEVPTYRDPVPPPVAPAQP
ncbi:MAG TPA: penicillin-binding protein 2 [Symbiobacteriaceae bacterium]|nr:penicillin-binding protein 2 [Symbiobacteriaceae bacterium]